MKWIEELNQDFFKQFVLKPYGKWLEEWAEDLKYKIRKPERYDFTPDDPQVEAWKTVLREVELELEKITS